MSRTIRIKLNEQDFIELVDGEVVIKTEANSDIEIILDSKKDLDIIDKNFLT